MNPWPCPTNNVTIRPVLGAPRRSGRPGAAPRAGAVLRTTPSVCSPTWLPAWFRPPPMRRSIPEAAASGGFRARFVDGETTTAQLRLVQLADRGLRLRIGAHFHEREAARASCRLIAHHRHRFDGSGPREHLVQLSFADFVRQISDVQLPTHKHGLLCRNRDAAEI